MVQIRDSNPVAPSAAVCSAAGVLCLLSYFLHIDWKAFSSLDLLVKNLYRCERPAFFLSVTPSDGGHAIHFPAELRRCRLWLFYVI